MDGSRTELAPDVLASLYRGRDDAA